MKKETTLSVLKDIRKILQDQSTGMDAKSAEEPDNSGFMKIDFPEKTAKEIVDECDNKLGDGKLLYSSWVGNEDFYTKEKTRKGIRYVSKEMIGMGKNWDECAALAKDQNGEMLNFAEMLFFFKTYFEQTGKYYTTNYSWSSSRSSSGRLVDLGRCARDGVYVGDDDPGRSASYLGLCFSEKINWK